MPERNQPRRNAGAWIGALVLLYAATAMAAGEEPWPALRNHNPFLQIFGLPVFEPGTGVIDGETRYAVDLDIANHADSSSTPAESVMLDGESHYLTLALRHGISDRLVLGVDIPFVSHSGGFLDAPIENWHELLGLSNSQRSGPRDQLILRYENPRLASFDLGSSSRGLGDIRLNATLPLWGRQAAADRQFGMRAGLKLPTGDASELLGSGAADYSLGLYGSDASLLSRLRISLSASAGVLFLGSGDVLPEIQRESVGFGGLAAAWNASESLDVAVALYAQGAYYDSELDEIGDGSIQLSVGGLYELPWKGTALSVSVIEDLFGNATTDFAFQVAIRGTLHQPGSSR
jgi:Protein of unknown function (DUF3187)